jgi:hypothetical protein
MPSEEPGKNISEAEIERRLTPTGRPPKAKIVLLGMNKRYMLVHISDGRVLEVPLARYPTLYRASEPAQLAYRIVGAGYGLEWPELDYHLSLEGMLRGKREHESVGAKTEKR